MIPPPVTRRKSLLPNDTAHMHGRDAPSLMRQPVSNHNQIARPGLLPRRDTDEGSGLLFTRVVRVVAPGGFVMRYLTTTAPYVGVDLHARTLFVCVLDSAGAVKLSRNMPAKPDPPPSLRGAPCESEYVLGAAAEFVRRATPRRDRQKQTARESRPHTWPPRIVQSTKAVDGDIFSLEYGTFIRVRPQLGGVMGKCRDEWMTATTATSVGPATR